MRWGGSDGPETDAEEFLLNEQVAMSFEIERTRRAYLERVTRRIENADATERDAVRELGERLFFDPCGPPALFGTRERDWEKVRSSWRGLAADPDHPAKLVLELESTETGCCFLLERWVELREHLESGGFWVGLDRLRAIRLLGRQPVEAISDRRMADIFAASHAIHRTGEGAFCELLADMSHTTHEKYVKDLRARWKDLVRPNQPEKARQILLDLVDQNIAEIEEILEEHEQQSLEEKTQRTLDRAGFDPSREGEAMRRHWVKCRSAFFRGNDAYRKYQKQRKEDAGRDTEERREEFRSYPSANRTENGARRPAEERPAGNIGRWREEVEASDVSACQGFVPERCTDGLYEGMAEAAEPAGTSAECGETITGLLDSGVACGGSDLGTGDGAPVAGFAAAATSDEKITNEPEDDDDVIMRQLKESLEVMADSGVESGLDKATNEPDAIRPMGDRAEWIGPPESDVPDPDRARMNTPTGRQKNGSPEVP